MALVPYRVSGPAADQRAAERLLQLPGGVTLHLAQWPLLSGAATPRPEAAAAGPPLNGLGSGAAAVAGNNHHANGRWGPPLSSLTNVGLVVWQAGFLLSDFLLRAAPECTPPARRAGGVAAAATIAGGSGGCSGWRSLTVVDLGTGSGVVGIALALAGARVYLTDLPHVLPLAAANVATNCDPRVHRTCVCAYRWGDDPAAEPAEPITDAIAGGGGPVISSLAGVEPDVITAADVLYHGDLLQPLMAALQLLSAPHTVSYVSYRARQGGEVAAFLVLAEAAGFAAEEVPQAALHEEYRAGGGGRPGVGGGDDYVEDSDADSGRDALSLSVEGAGARRWAPGTYGILRLSRRDGVLPAPGCPMAPVPAQPAAAGGVGAGIYGDGGGGAGSSGGS